MPLFLQLFSHSGKVSIYDTLLIRGCVIQAKYFVKRVNLPLPNAKQQANSNRKTTEKLLLCKIQISPMIFEIFGESARTRVVLGFENE